uniref:R-spondin 3 n=1 Tax=Cyclopterus lumpus TaxID=8103 RepID=A0A8C3AWT3_CYCLU
MLKRRKNIKLCFRGVVGHNPVSGLCPAGCATCSAPNGCLSCMPRLFFHLELDGMRQRGTCVSSCPRGHYGMRSPHISTCAKCSFGCEMCVSRAVCERCRADLYVLQGQCHLTCPRGFEPDVLLMQCVPQGERTNCHKLFPHFKKSNTRNRQVLRSPSVYGDPCPQVSEIRKCVIKMTPENVVINISEQLVRMRGPTRSTERETRVVKHVTRRSSQEL